ncbi:YgaP family membrane protein [Paraglaciecola hydrolytica]|uniref:Inner membrane protein YgaP-like transmembrane domain-containing protein n=1 Tax=Paraglaciecola hydrolytica TaxID=1799789 RepID=A0A135ZZD7_9ALTE|nr:DUF2892 domain-containing protein [Paraglaciecola hydrolytica]KXI28348.1 hypothetical protein AX660_18450 [Paraglaciecola hydrolytica]|tara:strand:- start:1051 stop:1269 length:219 start_codon:yes stop_codon:yes gene_type:complete
MSLINKNLCLADRVIRGILSVALIVFAIFWAEQIGDVLLQSLILVFAVLNLISFAIGWCPVYRLANISTFKR